MRLISMLARTYVRIYCHPWGHASAAGVATLPFGNLAPIGKAVVARDDHRAPIAVEVLHLEVGPVIGIVLIITLIVRKETSRSWAGGVDVIDERAVSAATSTRGWEASTRSSSAPE